ncbi:MAG: endolytic transglycosylase MltG [bacterium]|nr:endolytic transglycosylase MltG [bacterium]
MNKKNIIIFVAYFFLIFFTLSARALFSAPDNFPANSLVSVKEGSALSQIGSRLEADNIIKSDTSFVVFVKMFGLERAIKSGDYFFEKPNSLFRVIRRLVAADFEIKPMKVTVPEGATLSDIADIFAAAGFENFDKEEFLAITAGKEGRLFPDTYFFLPTATARQVAEAMKRNFKKRVGDIENNVLVMASLIEKEIAHRGDRRIVSGILWKRISVGMPLQVDAVFPYIKGKNNGRVTFSDLKIKSPYNTYLNKGLPPAPIANPGLDAIDAARHPEKSPYWFYLSGRDGVTHFSKTFEEHKRNRAKYLR